jgi:ribosomal protein S18 acetylase RimI-like enzyme
LRVASWPREFARTLMLPPPVVALILDEQAREGQRFIQGVDVAAYLDKLGQKAEILADWSGERCRGLVAYYCNDTTSRQAYISLVLVDPQDRGAGLGSALVACVLAIARARGFATCRLEVAQYNDEARAMYRAHGFRTIVADAVGGRETMEIAL